MGRGDNISRREASLEPWRERSIGDSPAEEYLPERTATIYGGADLVILRSFPIPGDVQVYRAGQLLADHATLLRGSPAPALEDLDVVAARVLHEDVA